MAVIQARAALAVLAEDPDDARGDADRRPRPVGRRDRHAREAALAHRRRGTRCPEEAVLTLLLRGPHSIEDAVGALRDAPPFPGPKRGRSTTSRSGPARCTPPTPTSSRRAMAGRAARVCCTQRCWRGDRTASSRSVVAALDDDPRLFLRIARAAACSPRLAALVRSLLTDARLVAVTRSAVLGDALSLRADLVETLTGRAWTAPTSSGSSRSPRRPRGLRCGLRCGGPRCSTCAGADSRNPIRRSAAGLRARPPRRRSARRRGARRGPHPHPRGRRALPGPRRRRIPTHADLAPRSPASARACGRSGTTTTPSAADPRSRPAIARPRRRPRPISPAPSPISPASCGRRGRMQKPSRRAARRSRLAGICCRRPHATRRHPRPRRRPRCGWARACGSSAAGRGRHRHARSRPAVPGHGRQQRRAPRPRSRPLARRPRRRPAGDRGARRSASRPAARPSSATRTSPPAHRNQHLVRFRALPRRCSGPVCGTWGRTRRASSRAATRCG